MVPKSGLREGCFNQFQIQLLSHFGQVKFIRNNQKSLHHSDFVPNFWKIERTFMLHSPVEACSRHGVPEAKHAILGAGTCSRSSRGRGRGRGRGPSTPTVRLSNFIVMIKQWKSCRCGWSVMWTLLKLFNQKTNCFAFKRYRNSSIKYLVDQCCQGMPSWLDRSVRAKCKPLWRNGRSPVRFALCGLEILKF